MNRITDACENITLPLRSVIKRRHSCLNSRVILQSFPSTCYRPQGKVMFSHASVILFISGLMDTQSLLILVGYSVTPCYGTHPPEILSCSE